MTDQIHLSSVVLNPALHRFRLPPRRPSLRKADYEDKFDFLTLFCDIFWDKSYDFAYMICPKLWNLWEELRLRFFELTSGIELNYRFCEGAYCDHIEIYGLEAAKGLHIRGDGIAIDIAIQPSMCDFFQDRRVVFAMTQDNDLEWITDWAEFYAHEHGADGILLYDHQTKDYTPDDIKTALRGKLPDETRVAVVHWPFPYGVFDNREELGHKIYDSCYCQCTIFEHARWRFLQGARSVVNADIDELILCDRERSVFQLTEQSSTGYLQFSGHWILPRRLRDAVGRPRHCDFLWFERHPHNITQTKWSVVPSRCIPQGQWRTHNISEMNPDVRSGQVSLKHFMGINTNWAPDRIFAECARGEAQLEAEHQVKDTQLDAAFTRMASKRECHKQNDSRSEVYKAYMWRIRAGQEAAQGNPINAIGYVDRALDILDQHPSFLAFKLILLKSTGRQDQASSLEQVLKSVLENDAAHIYQKAISYLEKLEFRAAEELLQQALELDPGLVDVYEAYGRLLALLNRHDERQDLILKLSKQIQSHRGDVAWLYRAAQMLAQHSSLAKETWQAVSWACQQESNAILALMKLRLNLVLDGPKRYEDDLLSLMDANPERCAFRLSDFCIRPTFFPLYNVPAHAASLLAEGYLGCERYRSARQVYCLELKRQPLNLECYLGLARIQEIEGRAKAVKMLLIRAKEVARLIGSTYTFNTSRIDTPLDHLESRISARAMLRRIKRKERFSELDTTLVASLQDSDSHAIEKQQAIEFLLGLGQVEAAELALQKHQGLFRDGETLYLHSQLQAAQGSFEAALISLQKAIENLGDQTYLLRIRTRIHQFRDDDPAILASQQDLIEHRSANPKDYQLLAIHHQSVGRLYSAIDITLRGLERFSQNPDLKALDSKLTQRREDIEKAVARLDQEIAAPGSQPRPDVLQAARTVCSTAIDTHRDLVCNFVAQGMLSGPMKQFFTGWIAYLDGNYQDAYNVLKDTHRGKARSALDCYYLGLAAYGAQADGFGVAYFQEALRKNSNHIIWRYALAKAFAATGEPEQASDELLAVLRQRPSHMAAQGLWRMIHSHPIRDEELRS